MTVNRDLRTGGVWTPGQRAKNDAIWALANLALAGSRLLPSHVLRHLGRAVGMAAHTFAIGARRTARMNVARVFPHVIEADRHALVRKSFITMGELLADAVGLLRRDAGPLLELAPEARTLLDDAMRERRGVLFVTAHLGPWERVAASLVAAGVPLTTLARESYDPRFARVYLALRSARGVGVLWRSSKGATAGIIRTLREGRVLGIPMDLRSRVSSCEASFLGHPAQTPVGPARIALKTGAAVVVGSVAPRPGTDAVDPRSLVVTATRISTHDLDGDTRTRACELTTLINHELSRRILALPHAWVWMHERWKEEDESMLVGGATSLR